MSRNAVIPRSRFMGISAQQHEYAMSPVFSWLGPLVCGTSQWPINVRRPAVFRSFEQWRWRHRQAEGFSTAVDL